ncbi:MAG: Rne/Rng family ribonuclease [Tannerella sp.]|nr:Rne/Rng family ribonuclease [Tannerella sp.]
MVSDIIVDVTAKEVSIAVLEDNVLVEFHRETRNESYAVGDIYLGKVKKLLPGLNAAFIDVGYKKEGFLHYQDLGPNFNTTHKYLKRIMSGDKKAPPFSKLSILPELEKEGKIVDVLAQGDAVLVQIAKEPISTKGPRLTTELSLAGRNLVMMPFSDKVSISGKIKSNEERARLRQLIQSVRPKNFGVIVRTSAEGKRVAELDHELRTLQKRFDDNVPRLPKAKLPSLFFEETSRIVALLRDVLNPTFENILINDKDFFANVLDYVTLISPEQKNIVKLYSGEQPIFDHYNVTRQIKQSLARTVTFKSGAYLIIEHTEAMHVVDVNSGNRLNKNKDSEPEENSLNVNLAAANEIARQLRLRDMGGIIVIDYIDMGEQANRQKLHEYMSEMMKKDRARHNILPLSKFGLMQITRQRVRPILDVETSEKCPTCLGTGHSKPSILFTETLEEKLEMLTKKLSMKKFRLHVHPYVYAYVTKGWISILRKWKLRYSTGMKVVADQSLGFLEYKFYDAEKNEFEVNDKIELK